MKFRSLSNQLDSIQAILRSMQAATKLTDDAVFRVSETGIQIFADPSYKNGPYLARCELLKENLFEKYEFKGVSPEHNLIYFGVNSDSLFNILHALKPSIKSLKIKLINSEGNPAMCISVEYPLLSESRFITHNVHITILNRNRWPPFEMQYRDPFDICLNMPNFKDMIMTIEKLASLAKYALIASKYQEDKAYLTIGLCNESILIKTKFSQLTLEDDANVLPRQSHVEEGQDKAYKVRINIFQLNQVFAGIALIKPTGATCSLRHEENVCFHFHNDLTSFKVMLPDYSE